MRLDQNLYAKEDGSPKNRNRNRLTAWMKKVIRDKHDKCVYKIDLFNDYFGFCVAMWAKHLFSLQKIF